MEPTAANIPFSQQLLVPKNHVVSAAVQREKKAQLLTSAKVSTPANTFTIQLMPAPVPAIPPSSNPAIVVPIVTFVGVLLTIGFGWWKTKVELSASAREANVEREQTRSQADTDRQHAAEQARKARLTTARREVYLELIKEMTTASMALSAMPMQTGDDVDVQSGFHGFLSAAARVGILGEMDTVIKSRELMILVQQLLYKKMPEIVALRVLKTEQAKFEKARQEALETAERLKNIVQQMFVSGKGLGDIKDWSETIDHTYTRVQEYQVSAQKTQDLHSAAVKKYQQSVLDDTAELARKMNELIISIRHELELSSDLDALQETTNQIYKSAKESMATMVKTLSN